MKTNGLIKFAILLALSATTGTTEWNAAGPAEKAIASTPAGQTSAVGDDEDFSSDRKSNDERTTTVGFPKLIFQHKITGPKVVAKPIADRDQAVIVRIVETYPHGSDFRYDIEYKGLEPGKFDIANYLQREEGTTEPIPPIEVEVFPMLAAEEVLPYNLPHVKSRYLSYYLPLMLVIGAAWLAGLLIILFYGLGKKQSPSGEKKQLTVADRLRPLIDAAVAGELTSQQQAELERVLSGFWSKKLRLNHLSADELRQQLRQHEEASRMLNQIDSWLHRPASDPLNTVDVNELLKPYQTISDDSF